MTGLITRSSIGTITSASALTSLSIDIVPGLFPADLATGSVMLFGDAPKHPGPTALLLHEALVEVGFAVIPAQWLQAGRTHPPTPGELELGQAPRHWNPICMLATMCFFHCTEVPVKTSIRAADELGWLCRTIRGAEPCILTILQMSHHYHLATSILLHLALTPVHIPIGPAHQTVLLFAAFRSTIRSLMKLHARTFMGKLNSCPTCCLLQLTYILVCNSVVSANMPNFSGTIHSHASLYLLQALFQRHLCYLFQPCKWETRSYLLHLAPACIQLPITATHWFLPLPTAIHGALGPVQLVQTKGRWNLIHVLATVL